MKLANLFSITALGMFLALPLTAAAEGETAGLMFGDHEPKGFLTDYSKISTTASADGAYRYRDPNADVGKYDKLLVDRIKIFFKEDSEYKGIDPDELKMLTDYFYEAIEREVGDVYPMVAEPGPTVLRLRIAVTDLVPNKPEASVVTLAVPFAWVVDGASGAAKGEVGSTAFTGEATIEGEALDSMSSQQLSAFIETEVAKKYNWSKGVGAGVSSYMKAYSKWDYTKKAIDAWAKLLRERLDETHGKAK
jgi:hypothetical protein